MADSYIQFSEELVVESEEEIAWIITLCNLIGPMPDDPHHFDDDGEPITELGKVAANILGDETEQFISFKVQPDRDGIWFYSDEGDAPEIVGLVVHEFFKKFRAGKDPIFCLTWSGSCSKLRVGEFGGGAMVVTDKEILSESTWDSLDNLKAKLSA